MDSEITLTVDGRSRTLTVDARTTLLDALRERLAIVAPKKGCDHGQCGTCTVLLDGRRHLTCLTLAVAVDGAEVVTADGLGGADGSGGEELHPVQEAFLEHDAFQCGYCTPGQVCSVVGLLDEAEAEGGVAELDDDTIRERMSGNLCRCGAYGGILAAIRQVQQSTQQSGQEVRA
ncbi:(2Fe-2S)-binding protein [Nocardioides massiliensis]|uniref:Xanthine dehydrogenase YagT iron-sulfur-binding subunit n=1 Tax=Nocardioides massiliensis TaxID=1325935 RepID=A0ABT9NUI8_9ACTN|nr:(2Fe-2S)-binding protein [Nocardioides massiliensis]MDP9823814.1 xanthine dehydrogenase YagT iron-sulfur-binding subunit [Nocardioides massiliensis]